jgi:hypothetical protein
LLLPCIVHSYLVLLLFCSYLALFTLALCCSLPPCIVVATLRCCSHLACCYLFPPCTIVVCLGCNHSSWVVII